MTMSEQLSKLEEQAIKRKERLKNLKRKFDEHSSTDINGKTEVAKPMFRSYKKDDEKISENITLPDVVPEIAEQLIKMQEPLEVKDIDLTSLAPRKVDFDLKRAIAKKLQKLEKRTNLAISELIRERLNKEVNKDLVEHVNIMTITEGKQSQQDVDSD